jgi:uncharacterized protein DUF5808
MPPSPRPPPPAWIGLGPPAGGALLVVALGAGWPVTFPAWMVLGGTVMVVGILELVASMTQRRKAGQPELAPLVDAGVALARLVSVAVASLESMIGVAIALQRPDAVPLTAGAGVLMVVLAVVSGVRRISAALEAVRAAGHGALVKGYGPLAYSNKEDSRIWVPKLGGVGYTLNFAHGASWLILAAFLVVPVAAAVLAISQVAQRR